MTNLAPYSGAAVSQAFRERWMSGNHVGAAKPACTVQVRKGRLIHRYHPYEEFSDPPFGDYPGAQGTGFWYPDFHADSAWTALDGIQNIRIEQSFDTNGVASCTIKMDNIALIEKSGHAGMLYHVASRGHYSPLRGFVGKGRPDPGVTKTPFFGLLPNAQIRVMQGYGSDQMACTFLGLIDDVDTASTPNEITITARDFGGVLVDERFFGWAKEKNVPSPTTFAPRSIAEDRLLVGGGADASSAAAGYSPDGVTQPGGQDWISGAHTDPDHVEWIQIVLPGGRYSQMFFGTPFDGLKAFIGVQPTPPAGGEATFNGQAMTLDGNGWWNPYGAVVPGADWSYMAQIESTQRNNGSHISLGGTLECGDHTVLRIGFRNLQPGPGGYVAGVSQFQGVQRRFVKEARHGRYIVYDDISDIVRTMLRWAGFKAWEVEDTGTTFQEVYVADQSKTFMDVINDIKDTVGYTFFIGEPRNPEDDLDIGYPIFRNNRVYEPVTGPTEFVDDRLLLTDAKVKITNQDDHCIIRCRGISKNDGITLDGDPVKRIMYAYIPPWAGEQAAKVAGVLKPLTHTDEKFTTIEDCQVGCYLIAIQIALLKYTAIIDLPCNPGIGLDTLQAVIDRQQGFNSRLYVTNRTQEMAFGPNGYWTMEVGGGLVDTPDMDGVLSDYAAALKLIKRHAKNPWLRKRDVGYQSG